MKFRTQLAVAFATVICFIIVTVLMIMHSILRDSYRQRESVVLETYGRQVASNIDSRMYYFQLYLRLLASDRNLSFAMANENFTYVTNMLERATAEFRKLNTARVASIRLYRNGIYSAVDGLGDIRAIFGEFKPGSVAYTENFLVTGAYLNSRNEKVFSLFQKVYQTNAAREYYIEMCVYETELYGFFNEALKGNRTFLFNGGKLMSASDRRQFGGLLYGSRAKRSFGVDRDDVSIPESAILVTVTGRFGFNTVIETDEEYLERGYTQMLSRMVPVLAVVAAIAFTFVVFISAGFNRRLKILQEKIAEISSPNLTKALRMGGRDEFGMLAEELDSTRKRILGLIAQNNSANEMMRVAEMSALRAQINSHFLFNSLSSIKWLSLRNDSALSEALDSLALFLRYALALNENMVPLSSEVKHLEAYVYLQKLRYRDTLNVHIDIEEDLLECKTVKLILQPLVENAIGHGTRGDETPLNITLYSSADETFYYLIVEDDGNGMAPDRVRDIRAEKPAKRARVGYGLRNVMERVRVSTGGLGNVTVESQENVGTKITIRQLILPQ
jgi:two-component system sensor histidine kinase YesM